MGRAIMAWMQLVATELSAQVKPIEWVSPVGLKCRQEYRLPKERRVQTLLGRTKYLSADRKGQLRKAKQRNSIAPNIVHSYDAAHLVKTVNACVEVDVGSFAVVHDSFGPTATPVVPSSDTGESITRSLPNCSSRPVIVLPTYQGLHNP